MCTRIYKSVMTVWETVLYLLLMCCLTVMEINIKQLYLCSDIKSNSCLSTRKLHLPNKNLNWKQLHAARRCKSVRVGAESQTAVKAGAPYVMEDVRLIFTVKSPEGSGSTFRLDSLSALEGELLAAGCWRTGHNVCRWSWFSFRLWGGAFVRTPALHL